MQQIRSTKRLHNPAVPYRQLTYLQFCMMPNLFQDYIDMLLNEQQYGKIGDIFVLYSQTLFQLKPLSLNQEKMMNQLKYTNQSAIAKQFLKLLTTIMTKLPLQLKHITYNMNVPNCLYACLINIIINQLKIEENENVSGQLQAQVNDVVTYYKSLGYYFVMLSLEDCIVKGKKISNLAEKYDLMDQIKQFYTNNLDPVRKNNTIYGKYCDNLLKLLQKLRYVFQLTSDSKQKQKSPQNSIFPQIPANLQNIHINSLYLHCINQEQKISFISWNYNNTIRTHKSNNQIQSYKKFQQIQLLCYLFLEQYQNYKMEIKYEVYFMLISLQMYQNYQIDKTYEEIKLLLAADRVPAIESSYFILYAIMNIDDVEVSNIKQIIDLLRKTYSKIHNNDKRYVKLAILSSLYLHYIGNRNFTVTSPQSSTPPNININIKSSNRKQLLQLLCQYDDIIWYINNKGILSYVLQLIFVGKEFKLFDIGNFQKGKNRVESFMEIQYHNTNLFHNFLPYKESQTSFYQYLVEITLTQDTIQPNTDHQIPHKKLLKLYQKILLKNKSLQSINQHTQYFHHKLLTFIFMTDNCSKFDQDVLQLVVGVLQQYCVVSYCENVNEKIIRLLFIILLYCLNDGFYKKEGLICYQLIQDKLPIEKVQKFIQQNNDNFKQISWQLFECIVNYQLVEVISENFRGIYEKMLVQWVTISENYLYNWPDSKKQKVILSKRQKFIKYLKNKIIKKKQQNIDV